MKSFALFSLLLIFSFEGHAVIKAKLSLTNNPTAQHILIAGEGGDLGTMFLEAALGKAHRILEAEPDAEVVLYSNINSSLEKETQKVLVAGLMIERADKKEFGLHSLVEEIQNGLPIASLSFLTHSAVSYGVHMYKGGRFSSSNPLWEGLKGHFTDKGYIFLSGCNTGFDLAPTLSRRLGVPVAGTLTSAEFQYLDEKSQWRYSAPVSPITYPEVSSNRKSFLTPVSCEAGACIRMQPLFNSYSGYWGEYKNGSFPAFKFFCGGVSSSRCEKVMAYSVFHQLTDIPLTAQSSYREFRKALQSYMCPRFNSAAAIQKCEAELERIEAQGELSTFSPALGTTLQCDANGCQFAFECKKAFFSRDEKCSLKKSEILSTTFVDEYRRYLRGFLN
ncbi:MAG: hypothetical protein KUL82_04480 [Bdellovibrio sp.]|nr:hypothetical protein [Bdellovibrio sp.]